MLGKVLPFEHLRVRILIRGPLVDVVSDLSSCHPEGMDSHQGKRWSLKAANFPVPIVPDRWQQEGLVVPYISGEPSFHANARRGFSPFGTHLAISKHFHVLLKIWTRLRRFPALWHWQVTVSTLRIYIEQPAGDAPSNAKVIVDHLMLSERLPRSGQMYFETCFRLSCSLVCHQLTSRFSRARNRSGQATQ